MSIGTYIRARREYLQLCYEHAQKHEIVAMLLIAFTTYELFAAFWPLVEVPSVNLPKIPLPWFLAIFLAATAFMIIEGGCRLRQKEVGQEHNLHLDGILRGTMGPPSYEQPKLSLLFRNIPKPNDSVGTASVRAALRWRDGDQIRDVSPLKWIGSEQTAIDIGVGESADLLVAAQGAGSSWNFGVTGPLAGTDSAWIFEQPFEFEITLLNSKNGRRVRIDEPLTFRWDWRDTGTISRPEIAPIDPPDWVAH